MRVGEQDGHFGSSKSNCPFPVITDCFIGFQSDSCMVNSDINVTNGLGVSGVHFEGIVSSVDSVKVNVMIEEDIEP